MFAAGNVAGAPGTAASLLAVTAHSHCSLSLLTVTVTDAHQKLLQQLRYSSCCCCCTCLQDYANALKLAAGSAQRDIVYQSMGADAAAAGDFKAAGAHYGRIVGGKPPFEELALLLVEAGDPEALQIFLNTKLQVRCLRHC